MKNWIIGIGGSNTDDVETYRVTGTEEQVKRHLIDVIDRDRQTVESETGEDWEYGTEDINGLQDFANHTKFYGNAVFADSHRDYTATLESEPMLL